MATFLEIWKTDINHCRKSIPQHCPFHLCSEIISSQNIIDFTFSLCFSNNTDDKTKAHIISNDLIRYKKIVYSQYNKGRHAQIRTFIFDYTYKFVHICCACVHIHVHIIATVNKGSCVLQSVYFGKTRLLRQM